jgi:hypothetical protein
VGVHRDRVPDEASLKETLKFLNTRQDLLTSVRAIYAHGFVIFAGFIVGFDHDTTDAFALQQRFITDSGIQAAMIGLLQATPKTPLYERLAADGRLILDTDSSDNVKLWTNVVPKGMTYDELVAGYRDLHRRLFDDRGIAARIRNKLRVLRRPVAGARYSVREALAIRISTQPDLTVCGEAADVAEALRLIGKTNPDVAVIAFTGSR